MHAVSARYKNTRRPSPKQRVAVAPRWPVAALEARRRCGLRAEGCEATIVTVPTCGGRMPTFVAGRVLKQPCDLRHLPMGGLSAEALVACARPHCESLVASISTTQDLHTLQMRAAASSLIAPCAASDLQRASPPPASPACPCPRCLRPAESGRLPPVLADAFRLGAGSGQRCSDLGGAHIVLEPFLASGALDPQGRGMPLANGACPLSNASQPPPARLTPHRTAGPTARPAALREALLLLLQPRRSNVRSSA